MKKTNFYKLFRYYIRRFAYNFKILRSLKSISREKYDEKISASLVYGFLSAVAVNFFFQPGHVYSSGATGLAQVITALSTRFLGFTIPVSVTFYAINIPLMILAWYQIGHKFTIFTFITVTMSSLFIQFVPEVTLTDNPIINALFGGVVMGTGIGFALKEKNGPECREYFLDCQWDYYADCGFDLWLGVCAVLHDYYFCIKPGDGCGIYQAEAYASYDYHQSSGQGD